MDNIRPIRSDADLAWALAEVSRYFDAPPLIGSAEADRFDVLSDLIEAYESRRHPIDAPDPIDFLTEFMAMTGRSQADLAALIGSRPRASEVLARKRPLTLAMIRRLADQWGLPGDALIRPPRAA